MKKGKRNHKGRNLRWILLMSLAAIILFVVFSTSAVNASSSNTNGRYKYYTTVYVDRDTTLWGIAQEYMTEEYSDTYDYMDEVMKINNLSSDKLEYGTTLCIPYYSDEYK